jgi:hypothetical protein
MKNNIVSFDNVVIPSSFMESRKTGIQHLDPFLSIHGGLVPSMSYMFTGESGSGKTTISNYIMSGISSETNPAVFISLEMSKEQTKYQFSGKFDFSNTFIVDTIPDKTHSGLIDLLKEIARLNPSVLVIDSLQMVSALIFGDPTSIKGQSEIAKSIMHFSKQTGCPTILIGQCNKDGDYLGPTFVKHILDAHLHATIDKKSGERFLEFEKNRFGKVGDSLPYSFNETGAITFSIKETINTTLKDFAWFKVKDILTAVFGKIIVDEIKTIDKSRIPRLSFQRHDGYYYGFNPDDNEIFIDIESAKKDWTDENLPDMRHVLSEFIDHYPQFKMPHELFYLSFLICMAYSLNYSQDHSKKFWKTLDRLVQKYS